jgi:integrase
MTAKIKYLWQRPETAMLWFRRRVPQDLRGILGLDYIQQSLDTADIRQAHRLVTGLVREQDAQWKALRSDAKEGVEAQARALLTQYGINPDRPEDTSEGALWAFHDSINEQLPQSVREDDTITEGPELDRHLSPVQRTALQMQQGRLKHRASDCQREYSARANTPQALKSATLPFQYLIAFIGDKPLAAYRRSDVRDFVDHLEKGKHTPTGKSISTTTIQRYVTTLRAAFARSIREHELPIGNVWAGTIEYSKDAKGEQKRESFDADQYKALRNGIGSPETTDDLGALLTLLAHTGARLSEVLGLRQDDCHLTVTTPYIHIQEYDTRTTKTDYSDRKVPLTPIALQALQRAMTLSNGEAARSGATCAYLFPRYTNDQGCRSNAASAALGIRLRSYGISATTHGLRHGMRDLLRAAQCPEGVVSEIQGWAKTGHVAKYGSGSPLPILSDWLNKTTKDIA